MSMEFKEYIAPLLKWWWLIVLATAVAGFSSYLATQQQQPVFRSSTTLIIGNAFENPNPSNNELFMSQVLASTYVDLANRQSVREDTMEALGLDWLPEIRVTQPNNSNTIDILVADTNPERARAVASELANQLILRSPTSEQDDQERQAFIDSQLDDYEKAITETQDQIVAKNEELGELISAREIANLQTEIETLETNLQRLQSNYALLLQSTQQGATNTIRILESASPAWLVDPGNTMTILTAAGIGFVMAASAAYVLEYLDDTIKTATDIEKQASLPTLAGIAKIKANAEDSRSITIRQPRSPVAEAFRVLRTSIQYSSVDDPARLLLVTSSTPQDGKSTISANLAVVLAQAGHKVLLIDADLRLPSQHELFTLPNTRGLTSLLLNFDRTNKDEQVEVLLNGDMHKTSVERLQVLTSGPIPPNPSELLGSVKMQELLNQLLKQYDYVVLDSPPVLSVTDAVVLSTKVDATLLVVRSHKSRKGSVRQAVQQLQDVDANLIGCVLNALPRRGADYSTYHYYKDAYSSTDMTSKQGKKDKRGPKIGGGLRERFSRGETGEASQLRSDNS